MMLALQTSPTCCSVAGLLQSSPCYSASKLSDRSTSVKLHTKFRFESVYPFIISTKWSRSPVFHCPCTRTRTTLLLVHAWCWLIDDFSGCGQIPSSV